MLKIYGSNWIKVAGRTVSHFGRVFTKTVNVTDGPTRVYSRIWSVTSRKVVEPENILNKMVQARNAHAA